MVLVFQGDAVVTVALLSVAALLGTQNQHSISIRIQISCLGCADMCRRKAWEETQTFCWNLNTEELLKTTSCTLYTSTAMQFSCQLHRTKYFIAGNLSQYRQHQITHRHRLYLYIFHHKVWHSLWHNRKCYPSWCNSPVRLLMYWFWMGFTHFIKYCSQYISCEVTGPAWSTEDCTVGSFDQHPIHVNIHFNILYYNQ